MSRYEVFLSTGLPPHSYLNQLPAVQWLQQGGRLVFEAPVTFLVGENGTGKSTLLEGIAVALGFNAEGGTRNFRFSTKDTHSELGPLLTVSRQRVVKDGFFFRAESFYNVASYVDEIYEDELRAHCQTSYGSRSLHQQSHGESVLALIQNRFQGGGLYLLDEPEAALSPTRILTLLGQIHVLVAQKAQFIISTHSPILMAYPGAILYQLSEQGIAQVSYRETEHFILTKQFLDHPERMLRYLLDENG